MLRQKIYFQSQNSKSETVRYVMTWSHGLTTLHFTIELTNRLFLREIIIKLTMNKDKISSDQFLSFLGSW